MILLVRMGYFDFFGKGTDLHTAERALDAAVRIDYRGGNGDD